MEGICPSDSYYALVRGSNYVKELLIVTFNSDLNTMSTFANKVFISSLRRFTYLAKITKLGN